MKEIRAYILAILVITAMAVAGCGGGGGGGGGTAGPTDPNEITFNAAKTLEPLASGVMSAAVGINAGGTVVGLSGTSSQQVRGVKWSVSSVDGTVSAASELAPLTGNGYSAAYGVNDAGSVVGESGDNGDANVVAVFWNAGGSVTKLNPLAAGNSAAYSISSAGRIVGEATNAGGSTVPVYWTSSSAIPAPLALLSGGTTGAAYFISEDGTIVGESETSGGEIHAVRWKIDATTGTAGNPTDLGTLSGHVKSVAMGVNSDGVIVGESESVGGEVHAVLWKAATLLGIPTGGMDVVDLGQAGVNSSASAINDASRITGWSNNPSGSSLNALWHALASPVTTMNSSFAVGAGSGLALGINGSGTVVGVLSDKGFVAVPK